MDNRVYYGEYSLRHWIDLILKKNIVLPEYQRYFVWDEKKVITLIETFTKSEFVPPVTIGAFKNGNTIQNLILDGQQRLTSILLAYLQLFPDPTTYKRTLDAFASEDDYEEDEEERLDDVFEWTFEFLMQKGKNKEDILRNITEGNYKRIDLNIDEDFLKSKFLGFSYLVPNISDEKLQQKYYSSVFRNINIQGQRLLLQESRESLYFLDNTLSGFFSPDFAKAISIKILSQTTKLDFVRYLSLLSQFKQDGNTGRIARGYKPRMETYYEEYIYSVVGQNDSTKFVDFLSVFPDKQFSPRFQVLSQTITSLEIPKQFTSIIDVDLYFFGLINSVVFDGKTIRLSDKEQLRQKLNDKIDEFRNDHSHSKAPGALKYLKSRIDSSVAIYKQHQND
jgi:uncharacterized protein with ParB-like and HNH nuclease domain